MDYHEYGACMIVIAGKLTYDVVLSLMINAKFKSVGIHHVPKLDNARIRIMLTMFSYAFMSSFDSHD